MLISYQISTYICLMYNMVKHLDKLDTIKVNQETG